MRGEKPNRGPCLCKHLGVRMSMMLGEVVRGWLWLRNGMRRETGGAYAEEVGGLGRIRALGFVLGAKGSH